MNGSHICTTCRRKISAKAFQKYPSTQWISRATFISLNAPQIPKPTPSERPHKNEDSNTNNRPRWSNNVPNAEASRAKAHGDLLEELFVDGLNRTSGNGATATLKPNTASLELYEQVEKLMEMLNDSSTPIPAMWALFTQICPKARPKGSQTPYSLHFAAKSLLRKLLTARQQPDVASGIPSVSEIAKTYASLGILEPKVWRPMLETFFTRESAEKLHVDGDIIAEDLLETWRIILTLGHNSSKAPALFIDIESRAKWSPPALNPVRVRRAMLERGIEQCFALLLPKSRNKLFHGLPASAIITFAILTDSRLNHPIPFAANHPFIKAIAEVIAMAQITPGELDQYVRTQNISHGVDLNDRWPSIIDQARSIANAPAPSMEIPRGATDKAFRRLVTNKETRVFRLLHRALAARDLDTAERLWSEVQSWSMENNGSEGHNILPTALKSSAPSAELCNLFISTFMALHKERAVDVWNFMIQSGLRPTVLTWHAMLEGCKTSRDSQSLVAIWSKLIDSDTSPDVECWTTLISGLMYCGDLEGGLRAFVEMRKVWEKAAKRHVAQAGKPIDTKSLGDIDGVVKPTIAIINATIAGLLRKNRTDIASQVLATGGEMGITPDNITYNTMLRSLVRNKDERAITNLLGQMQAQGVQGDVATFTIILENALSDAKNQSPQELIEIINNLFAQMDASAVKPNQQTYAAIINSILRRASDFEFVAAVNFVIAHMSKKGLQPSAHIHTMLVDFYFKQSEPKLDLIGLLLDQMIKGNAMRDHIFWDRVIEGYCYVGDTVRALQYLRQTQKEGFMAGYQALDMLIHSLVRNNEVDLARELVKNTRVQRGGPPEPDARGVDGQHQFWNSAAEMGLVEELSV
jgi:pentatricopeptide repeat protein